jgi:hypothetical protein
VVETVQAAADKLEKSTEPSVPKTEPGVTRVQVEEPAFDAATYLWAGSINVLSVMNRGIMVLFLTYFMLLTDDLFKRKLVEIVGPTLAEKKIPSGSWRTSPVRSSASF